MIAPPGIGMKLPIAPPIVPPIWLPLLCFIPSMPATDETSMPVPAPPIAPPAIEPRPEALETPSLDRTLVASFVADVVRPASWPAEVKSEPRPVAPPSWPRPPPWSAPAPDIEPTTALIRMSIGWARRAL